MKKLSLAAIIAVVLSTGLTVQTKAQISTANIENFDKITIGLKNPVNITETPVYNKAGKLLYTVKRYEESALPREISRMVRNQFYNFDITGVEEVILPSDTNSIYLVHIGNAQNLKTVRVYNGESGVISEYKKG